MSMLCYELCFALSSIISLIVRILGRDKVRLWVVTRRDATPDERTCMHPIAILLFPPSYSTLHQLVSAPTEICLNAIPRILQGEG